MDANQPEVAISESQLWLELQKDLIEQKQLLGVDRRIGAIFILFVAIMVLVTRIYWLGISVPPVWLAIWLATRDDPNMFDVYLRYAKQGHRYESIQKLPQRRNLRPDGFARGTLC